MDGSADGDDGEAHSLSLKEELRMREGKLERERDELKNERDELKHERDELKHERDELYGGHKKLDALNIAVAKGQTLTPEDGNALMNLKRLEEAITSKEAAITSKEAAITSKEEAISHGSTAPSAAEI